LSLCWSLSRGLDAAADVASTKGLDSSGKSLAGMRSGQEIMRFDRVRSRNLAGLSKGRRSQRSSAQVSIANSYPGPVHYEGVYKVFDFLGTSP
jgi:hypothetical protein